MLNRRVRLGKELVQLLNMHVACVQVAWQLTWVRHGYIEPVVSKENTISIGPPAPAPLATPEEVSPVPSTSSNFPVQIKH